MPESIYFEDSVIMTPARFTGALNNSVVMVEGGRITLVDEFHVVSSGTISESSADRLSRGMTRACRKLMSKWEYRMSKPWDRESDTL
jgi:hypothetical protein